MSSVSSAVRPRAAFTLIEFIGVLAVIALIAAVAYPQVIRRLDFAAKEREKIDLASISNSLVVRILSTKRIPAENQWASEVAAWTRLDLNKITTTPRRITRAFLVDTGGWFGTITLPYNNAPTVSPTNARILLVSSISGRLPAALLATQRHSAANFQTLWNTARDAVPAVFSGWPRGEDLVMQRISLDSLFNNLTLVNRDPTTPGYYSIDSSTAVTLLPPATNTFNAIRKAAYLRGTEVGLYLPDGLPQERFALVRDESYAFSGSRWGGDYYGSGSLEDTAQGFAYWAFRFMKSGSTLTAQQGASPEGAVVAMYNFMLVFSLWANKCDETGKHFPLYGENYGSGFVPEFMMLNDLAGGGVNNLGSKLSSYTGANGLLKYP